MGRKTRKETDDNRNELYRKRLRSWKSTSVNSNEITTTTTTNHKSTMFTYPMPSSNTILSESSTIESVFYCPTISYTSMQTIGDLNNNNHVTTLHNESNKRKYQRFSRESFSSEQTRQSMNTSSVIDDHIIDINRMDQHEQSNSMNVSVKMIQPIVDIIFNAFEDQLRTIQPISPLTRPVILNTVSFNIQLPGKSIDERITNEFSSDQLENQQQIVVIDRQRDNFDIKRNNQLQHHLAQLVAVAVSVLCGYFFL